MSKATLKKLIRKIVKEEIDPVIDVIENMTEVIAEELDLEIEELKDYILPDKAKNEEKRLQLYRLIVDKVVYTATENYYVVDIPSDLLEETRDLPNKLIFKMAELTRVYTHELITVMNVSVLILNEYKGGNQNV